jgi:hypothetical protein
MSRPAVAHLLTATAAPCQAAGSYPGPSSRPTVKWRPLIHSRCAWSTLENTTTRLSAGCTARPGLLGDRTQGGGSGAV